jgi:hypothetical protein
MMTITKSQADTLNAVVAEFGHGVFPLVISVENTMPRNAVFPELDSMLLFPAGHEKAKGNYKVNNLDQLKRFASSVSQIAELNGFDEAMRVSLAENLNVKAARTAANTPKTAPKAAEPKE